MTADEKLEQIARILHDVVSDHMTTAELQISRLLTGVAPSLEEWKAARRNTEAVMECTLNAAVSTTLNCWPH